MERLGSVFILYHEYLDFKPTRSLVSTLLSPFSFSILLLTMTHLKRRDWTTCIKSELY